MNELEKNQMLSIPVWDCNVPTKQGCISFEGFYYVNLVDGNTDKPTVGTGNGTYKGGFDVCQLVNYLSGEVVRKHDEAKSLESSYCNEVEMEGLSLPVWVECDKDGKPHVYDKGDYVVFNKMIFYSLVDDNTTAPDIATDPRGWLGGMRTSEYIAHVSKMANNDNKGENNG